MDNFDLVNFNMQDGDLPAPDADEDKPIPFDDSDPPAAPSTVSRKPLSLGSQGAAKAQASQNAVAVAKAKPAATVSKPVQVARQAAAVSKKVTQAVSGGGSRITGLKTFYTKLHPGALDFIDEQVHDWLKANPGVTIKQTNVTVGEVQAKKTEPNIIISIWY